MKFGGRIAVVSLAILLCGSIIILSLSDSTVSGAEVTNKIYTTLKGLGEATDLELETVLREDGLLIGFRCISSETEREYYFDDCGNLTKLITTMSDNAFEIESQNNTEDESVLDQEVIAIAGACMNDYQIGKLEIESKRNFMGIYDYEIVEYIDEVPTGSRVGMECLGNGTVIFAIPIRGQIFTKDNTGTLQLDYEATIDSVEAEEIARQTVEARVSGTSYEIMPKPFVTKLEAKRDKLYYNVEVATFSEKENYEVIYYVSVDLASGKVLDVVFTQ